MTAPLRVLVVQAFAENGGSEGWLLRLLDAAEAAGAGLEVEVVLLKDGPMRGELERRGLAVEVWSVGPQPWHLAAPAARLARLLRRRRPDVVLANVLKAALVAAPAGRLTRTPVVWAKHDHTYDATLAAPTARLCTRVVAAVEELGEAARRDDVVIIPPPRADEPPADRATARASLAAHGVRFGDCLQLVMAGRLVPFKGVADAVEALALPGAERWELVVVGEDDHAAPGETERLRALATARGVLDRVQLVGHVPGVSRFFAAFDALAVLTRPLGRRDPAREGFGTSAFEAMLAGIPVVAVGEGAVVRRLEGRAGVGLPPGDPQALAGALERLSDPAVREAAGRAAREIVADAPDAAACAALLVEVLRDAAATRRR